MTNYISSPLSTLNDDLNAIQTTLSSKADKSEIPEVPEDLSSFTNSPGYATSAYVQEYVDEHGGASGDYLPLSGGNLSGRIYLKKTETHIVGSACVFTYNSTESPYFGTIDSNVDVHFFVSLSVENAGQEFIDMMANGEWTGDGTDYAVKAYVEVTEDWYSTTKSATVTGTVSFGNSHSAGVIDVYLDFPEYSEDESNLAINQIIFNDNADSAPVMYIAFDADSNYYESTEGYLNDPFIWTIETVSEEVEVNEPFVLSSEIPEVSDFATKAEVSAKADLTALTALAFDVEDNYCTNQYANQTYASKNELSSAVDAINSTVSQTYATKNELSSAVGTINSILDSINGQVI